MRLGECEIHIGPVEGFSVGCYDYGTLEIEIGNWNCTNTVLNAMIENERDEYPDIASIGIINHEFLHYLLHVFVGTIASVTFDNLIQLTQDMDILGVPFF